MIGVYRYLLRPTTLHEKMPFMSFQTEISALERSFQPNYVRIWNRSTRKKNGTLFMFPIIYHEIWAQFISGYLNRVPSILFLVWLLFATYLYWDCCSMIMSKEVPSNKFIDISIKIPQTTVKTVEHYFFFKLHDESLMITI